MVIIFAMIGIIVVFVVVVVIRMVIVVILTLVIIEMVIANIRAILLEPTQVNQPRAGLSPDKAAEEAGKASRPRPESPNNLGALFWE